MEWLSVWDVVLIVAVAVVAGVTAKAQERQGWSYGVALLIYMAVFGVTLLAVRGIESLVGG